MKGRWPYALYLAPGLVLCTVVLIVPLLVTVSISFTRWDGIGTPEWIGLDNYTKLLADDDFWASFTNIGILTLAMVVVPTLAGLVLASVLFDYVAKAFSHRHASFFRSGFYLPQIMPVAVIGIVWGWILNPSDGALNRILDQIGLGFLRHNWLGDANLALPTVMVIMVWFQIGYPLVLFMAGLQRIDPDLYEAADLDGASWRRRFTAIAVPLLRPELYVVLITTTIATLKIFGQIYVLTGGGPGNATLVPSYFAYKNYFEKASVGYASAISTVITLIVLLLSVLFVRALLRSQDSGRA